jgi:hypothetical protein
LKAIGLNKYQNAEDFQTLWSEAEAIWVKNEQKPAFQGYVSADYEGIYRKLKKLRSRATTFLEWGSGLGVVTIMASCLGFEAYGIEVEPELVEYSRRLAEKFACKPTFACGSFIPSEFEARIANGDEFHRTIADEVSAYDQLDMELRDFDLVYAFPWPEELTVFRSMMRKCAAPSTLFLRYDAREGLALSRPAAKRQKR